MAPQVLRGFVIKVPCTHEHSCKKLSVVDVLVMQVLGGRPSRSLRCTCSQQPCLVIEHLLWAREPALKTGLMVPEEEEHLTLSLASVNINSYCSETHSRLENLVLPLINCNHGMTLVCEPEFLKHQVSYREYHFFAAGVVLM